MKHFRKTASNDNGVALIVVLLVLALLTIIGISATSTSTIEQRIAASDKVHDIVLYNTDAGMAAVAKLVNQAIFDHSMTATSEITFTPDLNTVYDQIKYPDTYDKGATDIQYTLNGTTVAMDVHRWAIRSGEGGNSLEFITGPQGAATGGGGGGYYYFRISAVGKDSQGVGSQLSVNYIRPGDNNVGGL